MTKQCFHCQEAIPSGFSANLRIGGEDQLFCCYGCLAIAETIVTGGLESFYQHRTQASEKPDVFNDSDITELRLYDDPELQKEFVESSGDFSELALSIGGITCAACIWLLEKEVSKKLNVESFTVNHTSHKARLKWNNALTKLSDVLILIRKLGYKAFPYEEGLARENAEKEKKTTIFRIAIAGIASMQNMMFSLPLYLGLYSGITIEFVSFFRLVSLLMCIPVVFFSAKPFFRAAYRDIKTGHLTMDIPVSIAILGAFTASSWITIFSEPSIESDVYFDSVSMFTFFLLLGRFIEMQTRHKHLNSDIEMSRLLPSTAVIKTEFGEKSIPAHKLNIDDILIVKQGQIIAADGIVIKGLSRVDESALSGEFLPLEKSQGSFVCGGTVNIENTLVIKLSAKPKDSRVAAIVKMLDKALNQKPRTILIADKVASYFVATVLLVSIGVGISWFFIDPDKVFPIVLSILVVTCPCALSLATPTALTSTNTFLRSRGFLITKSHVLEAMTQITDVIFDKTGTLTKGKLSLEKTNTYNNYTVDQVLEIAAGLEAHSSHPIASTFTPFFKSEAQDIINTLGKGLSGTYSIRNALNKKFVLGNLEFVSQFTTSNPCEAYPGLNLYLADAENIIAHFILSDSLRNDSLETIELFQEMGLTVHILSGDQADSVASIAEALHVDFYQASQSPEAKLAYVKALQAQGKEIAMVGDGINDLPVLSGAKLSIAMGEASDITKMNSDTILLNSQLLILTEAFKKAFQTRKIIKENISWAIAYNICMLPLAAAGYVPPYFAALGMSISSLIVVFNSIRLKR
ncbi:MAG: Cu2+-exporting ATPase [Oleiphilaceae bacterium]|jgi:Cu2+-exporting ATPase